MNTEINSPVLPRVLGGGFVAFVIVFAFLFPATFYYFSTVDGVWHLINQLDIIEKNGGKDSVIFGSDYIGGLWMSLSPISHSYWWFNLGGVLINAIDCSMLVMLFLRLSRMSCWKILIAVLIAYLSIMRTLSIDYYSVPFCLVLLWFHIFLSYIFSKKQPFIMFFVGSITAFLCLTRMSEITFISIPVVFWLLEQFRKNEDFHFKIYPLHIVFFLVGFFVVFAMGKYYIGTFQTSSVGQFEVAWIERLTYCFNYFGSIVILFLFGAVTSLLIMSFSDLLKHPLLSLVVGGSFFIIPWLHWSRMHFEGIDGYTLYFQSAIFLNCTIFIVAFLLFYNEKIFNDFLVFLRLSITINDFKKFFIILIYAVLLFPLGTSVKTFPLVWGESIILSFGILFIFFLTHYSFRFWWMLGIVGMIVVNSLFSYIIYGFGWPTKILAKKESPCRIMKYIHLSQDDISRISEYLEAAKFIPVGADILQIDTAVFGYLNNFPHVGNISMHSAKGRCKYLESLLKNKIFPDYIVMRNNGSSDAYLSLPLFQNFYTTHYQNHSVIILKYKNR